MAINLNDNIAVLGAKPTDARYLNNLAPYATISAATTAIASNKRYSGLTVNIAGVEYWFAEGVGNGDLVVKDSGIANSGITTANNGLTKVGTNVVLGGALTGATNISMAGSTSLIFTDIRATQVGIVYDEDYSTDFITHSLVDANYVTGLTSVKLLTSEFNSYTASTQPTIDGAVTGYTCLTNKSTSIGCLAMPYNVNGTDNTAYGVYALSANTTGDRNIAIGSCTLSNNTTGMNNVALGYYTLGSNIGGNNNNAQGNNALYSNTTGSYNIAIGQNALYSNISGITNIAQGISALFNNTIGKCNIAQGRNTLHSNTTGCNNIAQGINTLYNNTTGCNNIALGYEAGHSILGSNNIILGHCAGYNQTGSNKLYIANSQSCTLIYGDFGNKLVCIDNKLITCNFQMLSGATNNYVLTSDASGNASWTSSSASASITGGTNGLGVTGKNVCLGGTLIGSTDIDINSQALTITDTGGAGIEYSGDYSATFVTRSLVDKGYVDTIATGLHVKETVLVATTGNTLLSGTTTIDGVNMSVGDRVLVKAQTSGATNGIYVVSSGTWSRATDYDGTPDGEVENGDLIPVASGTTYTNTLWILTTANPITIDTTVLNFSKFSQLLNIAGGDGIDVTIVGTNQTISVDLASNSGLQFSSNCLTINSAIAGNGLTWTTGVLDVNAESCGSVGAIPVGYNAGDCLVVACSDIITALGTPINTANNGLTKSGTNVYLGGTLTGTTCINTGTYLLDIQNSTSGVHPYGINVDLSGPSMYFHCDVGGGIAAKIEVLRTGILAYTEDNSNFQGFKYANGFSTDVHDMKSCSIPDVGWVTGCTSTSGIQTASNGLTKSGTNVCLGGTLSDDVYITVPFSSGPHVLQIGNGVINWTGGKLYIVNSSDTPSGRYAVIGGRSDSSNESTITTCGICGIVSDVCVGGSGVTTTLAEHGLVYGADYSTDFTARSLVDKAYVDSCAGSSGIQTANNGLTKTGTNVVLGGALIGDTTISGAHTLALSSLTAFNTTATNIGLTGIVTATGAIIGTSTLNISGATHLDSTLRVDGITTFNSVGAGSTTDDVLTITSGGEVQKISSSSLGEDNNIYSKTIVTSATTLTTGSSYVILVNHTAAATITLPATPIDEQAFKIKDASSAGALTNNITIARNGNNIDRSASNVLINTDGGAIELVYDTTLGWFTLSFVN